MVLIFGMANLFCTMPASGASSFMPRRRTAVGATAGLAAGGAAGFLVAQKIGQALGINPQLVQLILAALGLVVGGGAGYYRDVQKIKVENAFRPVVEEVIEKIKNLADGEVLLGYDTELPKDNEKVPKGGNQPELINFLRDGSKDVLLGRYRRILAKDIIIANIAFSGDEGRQSMRIWIEALFYMWQQGFLSSELFGRFNDAALEHINKYIQANGLDSMNKDINVPALALYRIANSPSMFAPINPFLQKAYKDYMPEQVQFGNTIYYGKAKLKKLMGAIQGALVAKGIATRNISF